MIDFKYHLSELYKYRQLAWTFVWRDIKSRYRQSKIGIGWALVQPISMTIIFTVIFSRFLNVSSDGAPYPLFSFVALSTWTFIDRVVKASSHDLISNSGLINKIYFPREVLPLSTVASSLVDFGIASIITLILLVIYQTPIGWQLIFIPLVLLIQILMAVSLSLAASSLTVMFRDLQFVTPFLMQILMYASPVIYSVRNLQPNLKLLMFLNPATGIIEAYRSILVYQEMPNLSYLAVSLGFSLILMIFAYTLFKRIEAYMADFL